MTKPLQGRANLTLTGESSLEDSFAARSADLCDTLARYCGAVRPVQARLITAVIIATVPHAEPPFLDLSRGLHPARGGGLLRGHGLYAAADAGGIRRLCRRHQPR